MRISVAVQHHPARAELLPELAARLAPLDVEVVADPEPEGTPSSWRTYRRALELTPEWATHRLVIQDDTRPCRSFAAALEGAVAARPDRMLVLCVCGRPTVTARYVQIAHREGYAWTTLFRNQWVPTLAVVWPARLVRSALAAYERKQWPSRFQADDEIVARLLQTLREPSPLATVPSLVQHDDVVRSLLGTRHKARAGADEGRVAALFADDVVTDPSSIAWDTADLTRA